MPATGNSARTIPATTQNDNNALPLDSTQRKPPTTAGPEKNQEKREKEADRKGKTASEQSAGGSKDPRSRGPQVNL